MYELYEHDRVKKFFKKHKKDKSLLLRIHKKYLEILDNPYHSEFIELNSVKCPKCHRVRVGDYRIIFFVSEKHNQIEIIDIIKRKTDYRFF